MKIITKIGNLVDCEEEILIHGCNAQGKMNSGVAKAVREKYHEAFDFYEVKYKTDGLRLGEIIWVRSRSDNKTIGNCITQDKYGYDGKQYVDYDVLQLVFENLNSAMKIKSNLDSATAVAMPMIGAGLGGGDWAKISEIIEKTSTTYQPVVYVLK